MANMGDSLIKIRAAQPNGQRFCSSDRLDGCGRSFETAAPVVGMTPMVCKCENAQVIFKDSVIDGERKSPHRITPDISLDNAPALWCLQDHRERTIRRL